MKRDYSNKGFTIIELLFIIAIIGVLLSLGMLYAQKKTTNFKIQKSALQMEQILQAAIQFNKAHDRWPDYHLAQCSQTIPCPQGDDFCPYVPNISSLANNPWGIKTTLGSNYGGYCWYTDSNHLDFWIQTKLPNKELAKRLAVLLPNAQVQNDDRTVLARVSREVGGFPGIIGEGSVSLTCGESGVTCQQVDNKRVYENYENDDVKIDDTLKVTRATYTWAMQNPCRGMELKIYPFLGNYQAKQEPVGWAYWTSCHSFYIYVGQTNASCDQGYPLSSCSISTLFRRDSVGVSNLCQSTFRARAFYIAVCTPRT